MKHFFLIQPRVIGLVLAIFGFAALSVLPIFAAVDLSPIQKLTPTSGVDGASYGWSVARDGDTLMIGSTDDSAGLDAAGAVYVYTWNGTAWTFLQQLVASASTANDEFGTAIALDGDTAMISAVYDDDRAGSVFVFERDDISGLWAEVQKIVPNDSADDDLFGISIALSGDLAMIGAPGDVDNGGLPLKDGSFYAYERIVGIWEQQDRVIAPADSKIALGASLLLDGTTAYVSAVLDGTGINRLGAVYIYEYAAGDLTEVDKVIASDGALLDLFGASIRILGETLLVGAPGDDGTAAVDTGSVYVFNFLVDEWVQQDKIVAPDPDTYTSFGASMALDGDTLLVGAPNEMPQPDGALTGTEPGAAYVFAPSGETWTHQYTLTASNTNADYFGLSVALEGNMAIVGAFVDNKGQLDTGAVHVFALSSNVGPVNTVPVDDTITLKNTPTRFFRTEPDHALIVSDADSGTDPLLITLQAMNGTMTLSRVNNLTFIAGDGTGDSGMTFTGRKSDVNKAFDGLTFAPDNGFTGEATITLTSNDQGYVGTGGALEDSDVFTIQVEDAVELVKNGGFETKRANNNKLPANWTSQQLDGTDRLYCNTATKTFAYRQKCAFRFTGAQGRNPRLIQNITTALPAGDSIVLNAAFVHKNVIAGRVMQAVVKYTDNTTDKLNILLEAGTISSYETLSASLVPPKDVKSIKIQINYGKKSGNFYVDAVSLLHYPVVAPLALTADSLRGN